jgi:hypothetical protein
MDMYFYATEYMELTLEIHVVFYNSANKNHNILKILKFFVKLPFGTGFADN